MIQKHNIITTEHNNNNIAVSHTVLADVQPSTKPHFFVSYRFFQLTKKQKHITTTTKTTRLLQLQ